MGGACFAGDLRTGNSKEDDKEAEDSLDDYDNNEPSETYDPQALSLCDPEMVGYNFTAVVKSTPRANVVGSMSVSTEWLQMQQSMDEEAMNALVPIAQPRKRVVFISATQLNACIDSIPDYILQESIFCFKADRRWFFPSNPEEKVFADMSIASSINFSSKFLTTLYVKDTQGLVLWLSAQKSWRDISRKLAQITDIHKTYVAMTNGGSNSYSNLTNVTNTNSNADARDDLLVRASHPSAHPPPPPPPPQPSAGGLKNISLVRSEYIIDVSAMCRPSRSPDAGHADDEDDNTEEEEEEDDNSDAMSNEPFPVIEYSVLIANPDAIKLNPLKLEISWWLYNYRNRIGCRAKHAVNVDAIVGEILSCDCIFLPVMELLYQSNHTCIAMRGFDYDEYVAEHSTTVVAHADVDVGVDDGDVDVDAKEKERSRSNTHTAAVLSTMVTENEAAATAGSLSSQREAHMVANITQIQNYVRDETIVEIEEIVHGMEDGSTYDPDFEMIEEPMDYKNSNSAQMVYYEHGFHRRQT